MHKTKYAMQPKKLKKKKKKLKKRKLTTKSKSIKFDIRISKEKKKLLKVGNPLGVDK